SALHGRSRQAADWRPQLVELVCVVADPGLGMVEFTMENIQVFGEQYSLDHFLTQPLPTPLAWYAAQLPPSVLKIATGSMLLLELVLPFLIFSPRRLRFFAAFGILLLQSCILVTGNYNWFNLQTMLLCLPLFDDAAIRQLLPRGFASLRSVHRENKTSRRPVALLVVSALALLIVFCSVVEMDARFGGSPPALAQAIDRFVGPLHITSPYGLFAVMT